MVNPVAMRAPPTLPTARRKELLPGFWISDFGRGSAIKRPAANGASAAESSCLLDPAPRPRRPSLILRSAPPRSTDIALFVMRLALEVVDRAEAKDFRQLIQ